jgi:hypothetical protein
MLLAITSYAHAQIPTCIDLHNGFFVKSTIDWGIKKHLPNFKLQMETVTDAITATKEFNEVKLR